jgi:hypothetical protein
MQPLVIRQGDYLAKLADQLGFDADAVWGDDSNAQLRLLRPNPNILFAGDVLYVPDPAKAPPAQSLTPGSTNSFVTNAPAMVSVSITFTDPGLASQAYTVPELPQLTGLTTDANGLATLEVPVSQDSFTIAFATAGVSLLYQMGHLDPINSLSGIFQRLQHLGFLPTNINPFPLDPDMIRAGLLAFKAAQPGADAPPSSTPPSSGAPASSAPASSPPASSPPSSPAGASSSPGGSTVNPSQAPSVPAAGWDPPDSSSGSSPPPSGSAPSPPSGPAPASEPAPGSTAAPASGAGASPGSQPPPPESGPASQGASSSPGASNTSPPSSADPVEDTADDAGLNDDGTLDDATSQLLLTAHGA